MQSKRQGRAQAWVKWLSVATLLLSTLATGWAQTTAGTGTTVVFPITAQTATFASEITVFNPTGSALNASVAYYDANNLGSPGLKPCTNLAVPANRSLQFSLATQCTLGAGSHFGLLVVTDVTGTQPFYGYMRVSNFAGAGFSVEGFPAGNFNNQVSHSTGLKRVAAAPTFQTNCFVGTLDQPANYELRLFDDTSGAQIGATVTGALAAFQQLRYLNVFSAPPNGVGAPAGDQLNVRAQFTQTSGGSANLIGFCTVQDNASFGADFRIAKSYGVPGTVTSITAGTGLTGGTITSSGTINLASTQLLPTVACTNGQVPSWNGSAWTCADPSNFAGNITLQESTSAGVGNVMKGANLFIHNYGTFNTFIGEGAGNFAMTGTANTASGSGALNLNTTGNNNTAIGAGALLANTTGFNNTANGAGALEANTTGGANTASGTGALNLNTTGINNTANGAAALQNNTTGNNNAAGGAGALQNNTTGNNNTGFGTGALNLNTGGVSNTAVGLGALQNNTTGNNNAANGAVALQVNTTGNNNTATGKGALQINTTGSNNVAEGQGALASNTTGNFDTGLGVNANVIAGNLNNATAIGANAVVDASNHVRIGDTNVTQIGGQVGWSNLSDRREKKDIRALSLGLEFVLALRPVEYRMRNGNERIDFGFIAQDVEALVGTNYNLLGIGGTAERKLSLRYTDLVAPMVKAIQEQQALIEAQRAQIAELRIANAREVAELKRAVEVLMARTAPEGPVAALR